MTDTNEFALDWQRLLRTQREGARLVASERAASLKEEGYSPIEALDLLIADRFSSTDAKYAVASLWGAVESAPAVRAAQKVAVVPESYDDARPAIDAALDAVEHGEDFIDKLAFSSHPILNIKSRHAGEYVRLAERARRSATERENLHAALRPWVEETMLYSVLQAEKQQRVTRVSEDRETGRITVAVEMGRGMNRYAEECICSLERGTCSCERFQGGNFAEFGLACEHLVAAAQACAPENKLLRAVNSGASRARKQAG